ncbi:MAG: hypothetical protein P8Y44_13530, partial [Acidobacteriota bacterium]
MTVGTEEIAPRANLDGKLGRKGKFLQRRRNLKELRVTQKNSSWPLGVRCGEHLGRKDLLGAS